MTDTVTLPRSVVEQALEALKIGHQSAQDCAETFHVEMAGYKQQRHEALDAEVKQISDAIGALRAALEQEPEAWDNCRGERQCRIWCGNKHCVSHPAVQPPVVEQPQSVTDCHQSQPKGEQEPVAWQYRMRPDWGSKKDCWGPWQDCTKEQAAMYQRVPLLHDWAYESRQLYTHPQPKHEPLMDLVKDAFFEGFVSVETYNDTRLNSVEDAWAEYKAAHRIGGEA